MIRGRVEAEDEECGDDGEAVGIVIRRVRDRERAMPQTSKPGPIFADDAGT